MDKCQKEKTDLNNKNDKLSDQIEALESEI